MNFRDIVYSDINTKLPVTTIREVSTAKRHVIKISNVETNKAEYEQRTVKTKNLVASSTDRIALFSNEYVPSHFPEGEWITYSLTVNNKSYPVVPVNSNKKGIKVIKFSSFNDGEANAVIIDEPIKEAYLTITIKVPNVNETPFVSNLKLLVGRDSV